MHIRDKATPQGRRSTISCRRREATVPEARPGEMGFRLVFAHALTDWSWPNRDLGELLLSRRGLGERCVLITARRVGPSGSQLMVVNIRDLYGAKMVFLLNAIEVRG